MYRDLLITGFNISRHYETVTSTMDIASQLVEAGRPASGWSAVITADAQSAGRGRQGRSWLSTRGALMGTFVFTAASSVQDLAGYSLAVGVALAELLRSYSVTASLKWPNDLVVVIDESPRKIAGVLIETRETPNAIAVLVGVGINVAAAPAELGESAVSLSQLTDKPPRLENLVGPVALSLQRAHTRFVEEGGFVGFRDRWVELSCFIVGRSVLTIDKGDAVVTGTFVGVESTGALRLSVAGSECLIHSGHVLNIIL